MKKLFTLLCFMVFAIAAFSQGNITGTLLDGETNEPLIGASVVIEGTSNGTVTDFDGNFTLKNVSAGTYTLVISYIGYEDVKTETTVMNGDVNIGSVSVGSDAIGLSEIKVVASIAENRKTPVAVSNISSEEIELKVGNQEFPEILKSTPSIYATKGGGGFGDSRINVRGFDQNNVAVMINGIPVNDMENGQVYWSNWAGLADVTKTIQIQRGLGASKLAINSVGGTINIITKTTDQKRGGSVFTNVGNNGYLKYGATVSTGLNDNGWALTLSGSRTTGEGYVDATWMNAWSYFASIAKQVNDKHSLVFTAIGAPQRHGQRSFREGLKQYVSNEDIDRQFANVDDLKGQAVIAEQNNDFDLAAQLNTQAASEEATADQDYLDFIADSKVSDFDKQYVAQSTRYNGDWGRKDGEIFNNRENFYHKPQMALNHYWSMSDNAFLATSAYYSTGRGGGTGDLGRSGGRSPWGWRDSETDQIRYDDIVSWNQGQSVEGFTGTNPNTEYGYLNGTIRRASMNEHNWLGVLSTLDLDLSDNLKLLGGVDIRHYRGIHYRRVVDLLGNDAWYDNSNANSTFSPDRVVMGADDIGLLVGEDSGNFTVGDEASKIAYDNDGIVDWQGGFLQLEYSTDFFNVFGSGSISNTTYKREDRFNYLVDEPNNTDPTDANFNPVVSKPINYLGYNAKVGVNVNVTKRLNIYLNGGYYSKAPNFRTVFYRFNNTDVNEDAINETVIAAEGGIGFSSQKAQINLNAYYTNWLDRTLTSSFNDPISGERRAANIAGIDALHTGIELELAVYPTKGLTLKGMASIGNWEWKNDVETEVFDIDQNFLYDITVYADGLKVGDAAQTTLYGQIAYNFDFGLGFDVEIFHNDNLYANFEPVSRSNPDETVEEKQSLKLPSYNLMNAGLTYKFKFYNSDARFRVNVNNLLDELYIAETNDADTFYDSGGFFGFGRTWNAGLKVNF